MLNLSARQNFLHFIFLYFITLNSRVSTWIPCLAQHINKSTLYRALNGLHCTEAVVTQFAGDWAGSLSPSIVPRQLQSALVACEVLGVFQSRYQMQRCLECLLRPAYSQWQLTCTPVLCFWCQNLILSTTSYVLPVADKRKKWLIKTKKQNKSMKYILHQINSACKKHAKFFGDWLTCSNVVV